jgi:hypothetical protein
VRERLWKQSHPPGRGTRRSALWKTLTSSTTLQSIARATESETPETPARRNERQLALREFDAQFAPPFRRSAAAACATTAESGAEWASTRRSIQGRHDVGSEVRRQSIQATSASSVNGHPPRGRQSLRR